MFCFDFLAIVVGSYFWGVRFPVRAFFSLFFVFVPARAVFLVLVVGVVGRTRIPLHCAVLFFF